MTRSRIIQSRENAQFRALLDLAHSSRERRKRRQTFIEGIHLCQAYVASGARPVLVVCTEVALEHVEVSALVMLESVERIVLSPVLFRELSQVAQGVAIAFVITTPSIAMPERLTDTAIYLDRVQDPGNVGSILRTAAAAGVGHVITSPGTAFCWAPKVLRAAMGAHFQVDILEGVEWGVLEPRLSTPVVATAADAPEHLWNAALTAPCLWVFGNEGEGVSVALRERVQRWLSIPIAPEVESLNVAAAVAVCLFEQARQRSL